MEAHKGGEEPGGRSGVADGEGGLLRRILIVRAASFVSTLKPSCRSAATMMRVSRLKRAPCRVVVPFASAARISARFVMLFEPGNVTLPRTGRVNGTMGSLSGKVLTEWVGIDRDRLCRVP
jgi:hypothetical protein